MTLLVIYSSGLRRFLTADTQFNIVTYATVAQLVEQLIRNQQVGGSSPPSSSKRIGLKASLLLDRFSRFWGVFGEFLPEIQLTNKKRMTEYGKYAVRGHFLFGKQ